MDRTRIPFERIKFIDDHFLGEGPVGTVWGCKYQGEYVAVKALHAMRVNSNNVARLSELMKEFTSLSHRRVVNYHGFYENNNNFGIVMEHMENGSLLFHINHANQFHRSIICKIAHDVALGINYLHGRGILHRNLKPSNILFDGNFNASVSDCGMDIVRNEIVKPKAQPNDNSFAYLAPECFEVSGTYTSAGDIYSFSIILWELVAWRIAHRDSDAIEVAGQVQRGHRLIIPEQNFNLADLISKCWRPLQHDRPNSSTIVEEIEMISMLPDPRNDEETTQLDSATFILRDTDSPERKEGVQEVQQNSPTQDPSQIGRENHANSKIPRKLYLWVALLLLLVVGCAVGLSLYLTQKKSTGTTLEDQPVIKPFDFSSPVVATLPYGVALQSRAVVRRSDGRLIFSTATGNGSAIYISEGDDSAFLFAGSLSTSGFSDGVGTSALFNITRGIAIDDSYNLFVCDSANGRIRRITPDGTVSTFVGGGTGLEGQGLNVQLLYPTDIKRLKDGSFIVVDAFAHSILKVSSTGNVTKLAGTIQGFLDGSTSIARFDNPYSIAIGDDDSVYVADWQNFKIRKISNGIVSTFVGSTSKFSDGNGANSGFESPTYLIFHRDGNLLVGDANRVRRITPNGEVSTIAGSTKGSFDGPGKDALLNDIGSLFVEKDGSILVANYGGNTIRKITFK